MEMRACSKCGEVKPLETNFYRNRNSRGGWTAHCRACHFKRPRKPPRAPDGFKKCTACGEIKPATGDFWFAMPRGKYGLDARCKPCKKESLAKFKTPEKRRAFYEANKERLLAPMYARRAQERRENPERLRAYFQRWRDENRERYREMMRAGRANRQSRKRQSGGSCSVADIEKMKAAQKGRCWWCQKPYGRFHVDHRIPLAKGGTSDPSNLVLACRTCNQRKSARMPWQIDNPRLL